MDAHDLISFRRYGYRMIGSAAERAALHRRRYLGAGPLLNLTPANVAPGGALVGESWVPAPPPAPKPVISMHLHTAPPPTQPVKLSLHLQGRTLTPALPVAVTAAAPLPALPSTSDGGSFDPVTPPAGDACPWTNAKVGLVGVGGAAAGGLLMYVVGLMTREKKNRRKNPRRKRAGR